MSGSYSDNADVELLAELEEQAREMADMVEPRRPRELPEPGDGLLRATGGQAATDPPQAEWSQRERPARWHGQPFRDPH
jgi:hypothetical protein